MSKKTELAKNTAILTIGKICTQFLQFFLLPLYTGILLPEEYGTADLIITYTSLFLPLVLLQLDQAVFRFLIDSREDENAQKINISTTFYATLLLALCGCGIFFAVQFFIDSELKYYLILNIIANMFSHIMLQISRGLGDNITYSAASVLSAAVQILLNILLLVVFKLGAVAILVSPVVGNMAAAIWIFAKKRVDKYLSLKYFDKLQLKKLLKYSIPLIPNSLSWWILAASDRTIVSLYLGTGVNGLVTVSHKIANAFQATYSIFNMSWTESVSVHINDKDNEHFFSEIINNIFNLFACAAIGIIACMPFVYDIIIGSAYKEAEKLVPVFMIAAVINVIQCMYGCVYIALKKTKEMANSTVISAIINIITHVVLIRYIGMYAAPVSTFVGYIVMTVYRYFDIKKYINIPLKKSLIITNILFLTLTITSYYYGNKMICLAVLLIVAVYSVISNRKLLKSAVDIVRKKIKK